MKQTLLGIVFSFLWEVYIKVNLMIGFGKHII